VPNRPRVIGPRVLVLAPEIDGPGGIERASRSCIRAFGERYGSERVSLLTLGSPPDGLACRVLASGKSPNGRIGALGKLRFMLKALRVARRWKKNLVLMAVHPHLAPVAALASRITGAPCAVWCHGKESWGGMSRSTKAGLKRASLVFAPSLFTARQVESAAGLPVGSVRVVRHGLAHALLADTLSPARRADPPVAIAVARLASEDAYKGIDSLIHVWPRIAEWVPAAQLWVIGDGTDSGRLRAIANTLILDGKVQFFGRLSDDELARLYVSATVFALPARFRLEPTPEGEGFGLVYIEAGAAGLPVIGAKGGRVEDAIEHGQTGLHLDPEDPTELEHAIVRLLKDEVLAKQMGDEGRKRAESEFSYEAFADRICGVVDELFGQRRSQKATE
jgi:phosphatidylinositol alpha-1,6-mannosyltransferase